MVTTSITLLDRLRNEQDLETGDVLPNFGMTGGITRRAWSSDSRLIATSSKSDGIRIWNVEERTLIHTVAGQHLHSPYWLSDRNYLAWLHGGVDHPDGVVEIWDIDRLHRVKTIKLNPASSRLFSWSPDGDHFVTERNLTLAVWDVAAGQPIALFDQTGVNFGQRWTTPQYSWSADGRILSAIHTGRAYVANLDAANPQWRPIAGLEEPIQSDEIWMKQNTLATLSTVRNGSLRFDFWDLTNLRHLQRLTSDDGRFQQHSLSPDGSVVATNRVTELKTDPEENIFDRNDVKTELTFMKLEDRQVISRIPLKGSAYLNMHWSPDGRRVALQGNRSHKMDVVDAEHGRILYALEQPNSSPAASSTGDRLSFVFSPDSRWLAWPGQKQIDVLNADSGDVKWPLQPEYAKGVRSSRFLQNRSNIDALAWSPDGKRLAASAAQYETIGAYNVRFSRIHVWEWSDGEPTLAHTHRVAERRPRQLYFSPDSSKIAWGGQRHSGRTRPGARRTPVEERDSITVLELATGETKGCKLPGTRVRTIAWLNRKTLIFADASSNRPIFGTWNTDTDEIKTRVQKERFYQVFRTRDQSIAVCDFNQFQFWKDMKTWRSTLIVLSRDNQPVLVLVEPDGSYRTSSSKSQPLRFVAITTEGEQQLLLPDKFQQRFHWKPGPVETPEL